MSGFFLMRSRIFIIIVVAIGIISIIRRMVVVIRLWIFIVMIGIWTGVWIKIIIQKIVDVIFGIIIRMFDDIQILFEKWGLHLERGAALFSRSERQIMSFLCRERVSTAHCFSDYVTNYVTPNDACILDVAKLFVNNLLFTKKQSASPDLTDAICLCVIFFWNINEQLFHPLDGFLWSGDLDSLT